MKKTLVVVDMQIFEPGAKKCLGRVIKLIRRFKAAGNPIIVLQYEGSGSTIQSVLDMVKNYRRWALVPKEDYGGGREVLKKCRARRWPLDFVLCGVAYDCCVQETADTLVEEAPVEVVLDCTDAAANDLWKGDSKVNVTKRFSA